MIAKILTSTIILLLCFQKPFAQKVLPDFDIRSSGGRVILSWKYQFGKTATAVTIQRSFDSTRNFTTIGSMLNPTAEENGYLDPSPPYHAMYYRIFIAFEGGSYIISDSKKAVDTSKKTLYGVNYAWDLNKHEYSEVKADIPNIINVAPPPNTNEKKQKDQPLVSNRIFTSKENRLIIYLPAYQSKNYTAKFFDEGMNPIFELTNLKEEYLFLDKFNFPKSGIYYFDLYENGVLLEKNKFIIPKDPPKPNR